MSESDNGNEYKGPGLLTETQRKYLAGQSDIESGTARERTIRGRIRERLISGLWDLAAMRIHLENRDIEQAASNTDFERFDIDNIVELILKVYFISTSYSPNDQDDADELSQRLEEMLITSITGIYNRHGREIEDLAVDIDITLGKDIAEITEQELQSLDTVQIAQLIPADEIANKELISELERRNVGLAQVLAEESDDGT